MRPLIIWKKTFDGYKSVFLWDLYMKKDLYWIQLLCFYETFNYEKRLDGYKSVFLWDLYMKKDLMDANLCFYETFNYMKKDLYWIQLLCFYETFNYEKRLDGYKSVFLWDLYMKKDFYWIQLCVSMRPLIMKKDF